MSPAEIISLVAVTLSFITSLYALSYSKLSIKSAFKTASARTEIHVRTAVNHAIQYMEERTIAYRLDQSKLNKEILDHSVLRLANLYDDVCGLYLRAKIDKRGFFPNYENELVDMVNVIQKEFPEHMIYYPRLAFIIEIINCPTKMEREQKIRRRRDIDRQTY